MSVQPMPDPGIWECCNGRAGDGHRIVFSRHPLWWLKDRLSR